MLTELLISLLPGLRVEKSQATAVRIILSLSSIELTAVCPLCSQSSNSIHSLYSRTLADLPWCGVPVALQLRVRKFFCRNKGCKRKIFTERIPRVTLPYSRQTTRLRKEQRQLCLESGGETAARTSLRQGFPTSAKTHIRRVCHTPVASAPTPRLLGVDDWAMRKGQRYGTILVDLEGHRPVDLLPDRSAATLEHWLQEHPGIELITRDRSNEYAEGARRGAPDAIQVADRFHLVKNAHEVLQRVLERHNTSLCAAALAVNEASLEGVDQALPGDTADCGTEEEQPPLVASTVAPTAPASDVAPCEHLSKYQQLIQDRRAKRYALYCEVQLLRTQDVSIRQISRQLGIHYGTVRRFLAGHFPERASRPSLPSKLDPHLPFLKQQLMAGQDNGMQLWRDLCSEHGYRGSRALVSRWVAANRSLCPPKPATTIRKGRPPNPKPHKPAPRFKTPSARAATWLLVANCDSLNEDQGGFVEHLLTICPDAQIGQRLTADFQRMVTERDAQAFDGWLATVESHNLAEFMNFAAGLRRDEAAVRAALSYPHSNGQVEGQITRLKLIKRSMYGGASFELLKRRVLAA